MVIKTYHDYIDELQKLYPGLSKKALVAICYHGWKNIKKYTATGADILIHSQGFHLIIGQLHIDTLEHFDYYRRKLAIKINRLYPLYTQWDGYYYFALNRAEYQAYLDQQNKGRGPKVKWFNFKKLKLWKWYDACRTHSMWATAIFRIPMIQDWGSIRYIKELRTKDAELYSLEGPLRYKDIMTENYKYKF